MDMNSKTTAVLVIDVHRGLLRKSTSIYKAEDCLRNINLVIGQAHQASMLVFYIQHSDTKTLRKGSWDWQLHPDLNPVKQDYLIYKQHGNAINDTTLSDILRSKNISDLVITGLVTHACVRATCIGAQQLGDEVILVKHGHSNYSKQAAKLIDEWNLKLGALQIELSLTSEIKFN
jgi:nicotinamidase-related amidase